MKTDPHKIHLIGICGTGMGSLAGLFAAAGHEVRGSDENVYPPMSTMLEKQGIRLMPGYSPSNLDWHPDLVVIGNIVTRTNPEGEEVLRRGLPYRSFPQAVGEFFLEGRHPVVVAGTHGKTTTTALMGWVLMEAGRDPSWLVGGVLCGQERSFRLGKGSHFVIEGDEYESAYFDKGSKFLHYRPRTALLTSVEFDHAEMFQDLDSVKRAFAAFLALVPEDGALVVCADDPEVRAIAAKCRGQKIEYAVREKAAWVGRTRKATQDGILFDVFRGNERYASFSSPLTGAHNLANILAVVAACSQLGLEPEEIGKGLASFPGVKRRQEIRGIRRGMTVVDDFAHHPTAVRGTIAALAERFAGQRLWAVFEPRTNTSRRAIFQADYAEAFDQADEVIVSAVDHPERAPQGDRFSAQKLVEDLQGRGLSARYIPEVAAIVKTLAQESRDGDVVLIMSNGSFGGIHQRLLDALGEGGSG
ncbi:MAG TPA: UDP-N-acetylmuramate:L-alanyl-gamma-D-glutamyl-meso-diaminopimelate ligase [Candidatus Polarisedimenticolia bacterium]|nr:UDP-N-acetylmuramate:L-alanyl-gamma-D-glutamyl-meso-diaminopimelate ligase [Candidatus Polarisedimenticolia bacterium]